MIIVQFIVFISLVTDQNRVIIARSCRSFKSSNTDDTYGITTLPSMCLQMFQHRHVLELQHAPWAPSQYPKKRLFVRSRKVSKPRDWYFKLSYRFEIWQAHRQHCCRSACQISERSDNSKYKSRGFESLRDLTKRRLFRYWDGALMTTKLYSFVCPCVHVCAVPSNTHTTITFSQWLSILCCPVSL